MIVGKIYEILDHLKKNCIKKIWCGGCGQDLKYKVVTEGYGDQVGVQVEPCQFCTRSSEILLKNRSL